VPSLLFPTSHSERTTDRGSFSCPSCRSTREFRRVVVGRVVRVFAMRLPAGVYGEYVECADCLATFRPAALVWGASGAPDHLAAEYERALLRVLALLVISDGHIDPAEVATVQRIFAAVTGHELQRDAVIAEAREAAAAPSTAARFLAGVVGFLNDHGREQILRGAAMVTGADGRVHHSEAEVVRRLGAVLQLPDDRVEYVLRAFT
jgi:uncharacterized tellurite resistance protein B-like protein